MGLIDSGNDFSTATFRSRSKRSGETEQVGTWTLALVDAGIAGVLIVVPFAMGGRTPAGQLVFVGLAFWTCLWWTLHQALGHGQRTWRGALAFWPMLAALGLVLFQLVPLPPGLLEKLSPHIHQILPLWMSPTPDHTTLGTWSTLSLTPDTTHQSFGLLLSGVLLFAVTVQRIQRIADVERIIRCLAISVSLMAVFGIVQFLASNGKFFWVFEHPYSATDGCVKGAFTNRNHFAHFIALGFGAVLWWMFDGKSDRRSRSSRHRQFGSGPPKVSLDRTFKALLVPICAVAALMSFSRGGAAAVLVSCTAALYLLFHAGKLSRQAFAALAGLGLIVCLGLSIYGYDALAQRFQSNHSLASLDNRSKLWAAACEGFGDHPVCGTGLSSHRSVCPMYLEPTPGDDIGLFYSHAENGYVQLALETGGLGLLLVLIAIGIHLFWCAASLNGEADSRTVLCFAAILPAILVSVVHSAMDYVWYVPGCMGVVAILGASACRLYQLTSRPETAKSPSRQWPAFAWGGGALLLLALGGSVLPSFWQAFQADGPWNRYLLLRQSLTKLNNETDYDDILAESESRKQILLAMEKELTRALEKRSDWGLAHAEAARTCRKLFHEYQATSENPFNIRDIRDAVEQSCGNREEARTWLQNGVGPHSSYLYKILKHAHLAVRREPLLGECYMILAEISFMEGLQDPSDSFLEESEVPSKSAYVAQAARVRPSDGTVLFEMAAELGLAGEGPRALECLKRSFSRGREHQERVIEKLVSSGMVPARQILEVFHPDADALQVMLSFYRRPELSAELDCVLSAHAAACEAEAQSDLPDKEAAKYWARAASSYGSLKNPIRRHVCLQHAVALDTTNFDIRYALGRACLAVDDFAEAEKQLRWCVQRKPGHPEASRLLEQAVGKGIAAAHSSKIVKEAGLPSSHRRR